MLLSDMDGTLLNSKKADNGCRQSSDRALYASRRKIHGSHGAHDTVF